MSNESIPCRCAHCGSRFRVKARFAGKKGRCPNEACRKPVVVPAQKATRKKQPIDTRTGSPPPKPLPPRQSRTTARRQDSRRKPKPSTNRSNLRVWAAIASPLCLAAVAGLIWAAQPESNSTAVGEKPTPTLPVFAEAPEPVPPSFAEALEPFLKSNCIDCHSGEMPEGDLDLAADKSTADVLANRARWEKAFDMVRIGAMPPPDYSTPSEEETEAVVAWLDDTLFHVDCEANPDPGRVTARRLNKTEYANTVRDLFGIDFDPSDNFPSDEVGYGFDNIGDVLTVPPLLMEKYLDASEQIASRVVLSGDPDLVFAAQDASKLKSDGGAYPDRGNGRLTMAASGATAKYANAQFPRTAEYIIRIEAGGNQAGDEPVKLDVKVDGKSIGKLEVPAKADDPKRYDLRKKFDKGKRTISVTFINDYYKKRVGDRNAFVYSIEVVGPFGIDKANLPETHQQLTRVRPDKNRSVIEAATTNLKPFVRRAFRRAVSDSEIEPFARFADLAVERGETFESGMQVAVQAMLVSPRFLFRIEEDDGTTGRLARRLDAFELASRLSYFLWNSMPDDRLLELAESRDLLRDDVLEAEARRLLEDPRADEMIDNFAGQWLGLRRLSSLSPDTSVFPNYSDALRSDMAEETYSFVRHVLRSDRPITELLSARYSFMNQRLAKHYDIPEIKGDDFQRVDFKSQPRAGLLTHASILMLTSYPNRTSPVKRGEWVLANILGDEPPPAPPNVPTLEETQAETKGLTLREQMAKHREDPSCAACHRTMDAIGFGLENYDAIGRWREKDGEHQVDASGELPGGSQFNGAVELVAVLSSKEDEFVETFAERLLTFALGRGVEYTDRCVLDEIVDDAKSNDKTFVSVVNAIVRSKSFRYQGPASQ